MDVHMCVMNVYTNLLNACFLIWLLTPTYKMTISCLLRLTGKTKTQNIIKKDKALLFKGKQIIY